MFCRQEEAIRCRNRLEVEKQNLVEEVGSLQKSLNKEKGEPLIIALPLHLFIALCLIMYI